MKNTLRIELAEELLRVRLGQMIVNEKCKEGAFKIPIHLAFGHEAIAVAIARSMEETDQLVLTHRNIHYNIARDKSIKNEINEYLLKENGLANGRLGSMNLANAKAGIIYTSSILGNNFGVAAGLALAQSIKGANGVVICVTGDGAIEEGSFYETLLFLKSNKLSSLIVIENNGWSLATRIYERRAEIDISQFTAGLKIRYNKLEGNDVGAYLDVIDRSREYAINNNTPVCIEVDVSTLGDWLLVNGEYPSGKFINYHAGAAAQINLSKWPVIKESVEDPIFVLQQYFTKPKLKKMVKKILGLLQDDLQ